MLPRTLLGAAALLLGLWLALTAGPAIGDPGLEEALHAAVNRTRAAHHRMALERRADLDAVARAHSADMARRRYLSHDTPEGANPVDRIQRSGLDGFTLAGENVGMTSRSDPNREILDGWLVSPVHRENLLAPAFNATGIGVARAADGTLYYTQLYVTFPR